MKVAKATPAVPRTSPSWRKHAPGVLAVPVALALVTGAPGLAYATFSAGTTAALGVGTYSIPAPSSINGTLKCETVSGQKGAVITFTDVGDVERATGYTATLTPPGGTPSVVLVPGQGAFQVTMRSTSGRGKYTFRLTAEVGSWTGAPLEQIVTC